MATPDAGGPSRQPSTPCVDGGPHGTTIRNARDTSTVLPTSLSERYQTAEKVGMRRGKIWNPTATISVQTPALFLRYLEMGTRMSATKGFPPPRPRPRPRLVKP
ncbi:2ab51d16-519b-4b32-888b-172b68b35401 [Thermothielavioides terrestris]|uniref:2ab51d16-519b-4b32-888b-172b68b35401 n=1 Tax=Thermothielavioides terrestris TaxID=2587410 RepID=A0A3S4EWW2_9PEZI|nr:2ab51d16-519b-4b32-888b-172b68b35401 [Thermothielavioides terrestris]